MTQVQPPIPEAPGCKQAAIAESESGAKIDPYDINPKHEESLLAGTDRWYTFSFTAKSPRGRGCWVTMHDPEKEDVEEASKYFPQGIQPWSVGAWMEDAELNIAAPREWKL